MSGRERSQRYRERSRDGGLVTVTVIVPEDRVEELKQFAEELRGGRPPRAARRRRVDPTQTNLLDEME